MTKYTQIQVAGERMSSAITVLNTTPDVLDSPESCGVKINWPAYGAVDVELSEKFYRAFGKALKLARALQRANPRTKKEKRTKP